MPDGQVSRTGDNHGARPRRRDRRDPVSLQALALALLIAIPLLVGFLGSQVTSGEVEGWYAQADKAPWNPPDWVFGPVWTALYIVIGAASWMVWRRRRQRGGYAALSLYVTQLVLNSIWSPLFFGGYPLWDTAALWAAFAVIIALIITIFLTIAMFWKVQRAGAILLAPYLGWVLYASTLNLYIALMN